MPRRFWRPVGAAAVRDGDSEYIETRFAANRSRKGAVSFSLSVKSDPQEMGPKNRGWGWDGVEFGAMQGSLGRVGGVSG